MTITKFLLIVWFGMGQSQTMTLETFDSEAECLAVRQISAETFPSSWKATYECKPYTFYLEE